MSSHGRDSDRVRADIAAPFLDLSARAALYDHSGTVSVGGYPGLVGIVLAHRRRDFLRVGAQVLLIDDTVLVDDEGGHAGVAVARRICHHGKALGQLAVVEIVLGASGRIFPCAVRVLK